MSMTYCVSKALTSSFWKILSNSIALLIIFISFATISYAQPTGATPENSPSSPSDTPSEPGFNPPILSGGNINGNNGDESEEVINDFDLETFRNSFDPSELANVFDIPDPSISEDEESRHDAQIVTADGVKRIAMGRGNKALKLSYKTPRDITTAMVERKPAHTTDFRCFYWRSGKRNSVKNELPTHGDVSEIFTENRPLSTAFEEAEQLLCFDIAVDQGEVFFLFEEVEVEAEAGGEAGGTFFANMVVPAAYRHKTEMFEGNPVWLKSARLVGAASPEVTCELITTSGEYLGPLRMGDKPYIPGVPLAIDENMKITGVTCMYGIAERKVKIQA